MVGRRPLRKERIPVTSKQGSKSSVAIDWVRERVLSGELSTGEIVRPEDVGNALGISATPAREALQALRAEGFLESQPGTGFVAAPLTDNDILDIFVAHAFLAGEVAARAVCAASEDDVDELEAVNFELLAAARRRQWKQVEERNHQFHRRITLLADSPRLAQILGLVSRYVPRTMYSSIDGWAEASSSDHSAIISAFRDRDSSAARRAMSEHIEHAGNLLAEQYRQR